MFFWEQSILSHLLLWNGIFLWKCKLISVVQDAEQLSYLQFKKGKKNILNLKVNSTKFLKKYISIILLYNITTFKYILEPNFSICFKYNRFNRAFSALAGYIYLLCQLLHVSPEQWVCFQWSPFLLPRWNTGWCFIETHCKQILPTAKAFRFVTLD